MMDKTYHKLVSQLICSFLTCAEPAKTQLSDCAYLYNKNVAVKMENNNKINLTEIMLN